MTLVNAYAAPSATEPLVPITLERREVGPHDVAIEIAYAGICHSDIHTVRGDWGPITYPQVVGHEIVGVVTEIGGAVTRHAVGDRVGVGCMVNSCRECERCLAGVEQYCSRGFVDTFNGVDVDGSITQGGYATHIVVTEDFVLRVPGAIPYEAAAPLLCAGITTYSPLAHWKVGPGSRVAVVGLGGLGHLAVKIAHAMGAEVTVLSRGREKEADARRLGADRYVATGEDGALAALVDSFDLILNTVSAPLDVNAYLATLRLDGTLVALGAPPEALGVQVFTVFGNRGSLAGSTIGGIRETQEMLDFCAEHGIASDVEVITAAEINEAYERVLAADVRYRFVIDAASFR